MLWFKELNIDDLEIERIFSVPPLELYACHYVYNTFPEEISYEGMLILIKERQEALLAESLST